MKKVCIVTASRSEYGPLRWIIDTINNDIDLELQLIVTGAHLSEEQGFTYKDIEADGYPILAKVDMDLKTDSKLNIAQSMGRCAIGMSNVFDQIAPNLIVVLGDRYELLPVCNTALILNIPIAHISGGDITIGAIDNDIRNAITMMASLHFPSVADSAINIIRMRGNENNVFVVGEPGLENLKRLQLLNRKQLIKILNIKKENRWILLSLHPETQETLEYNIELAVNIIAVLDKVNDISVVITKANADYGGVQLNEYFGLVVKKDPQKYSIYSSLGQTRYLSFMKECFVIIGNSSSGILEAPSVGTQVINIGNRQKGRHLCDNVTQADNSLLSIQNAWKLVEQKGTMTVKDYYYGDGNTSFKVVDLIKQYLNKKIQG